MKIYAMRKYCLTYDAKNSKVSYDTESYKKKIIEDENLKKRIAKILIDGGAVNLESYIASTITFYDELENVRFNHWVEVLRLIEEEIFYELSLVAKGTKGPMSKTKGNKELNENFQKIIQPIRKAN